MPSPPARADRTLTDADIAAIASQVLAGLDYDAVADKVETRMIERFQLETGKAIWTTTKRWAVKVMIWGSLFLMVHQAGMDRPFVEAILKSRQ